MKRAVSPKKETLEVARNYLVGKEAVGSIFSTRHMLISKIFHFDVEHNEYQQKRLFQKMILYHMVMTTGINFSLNISN